MYYFGVCFVFLNFRIMLYINVWDCKCICSNIYNVCLYLCRYIYMKDWFFVNNNIYVLINVIIICSLGIVLWVDII